MKEFEICIVCCLFCSHMVLEHEVACLDINPPSRDSSHSELVAVGLWTEISVRVLKLPSLDLVLTQQLGGGKPVNGTLACLLLSTGMEIVVGG